MAYKSERFAADWVNIAQISVHFVWEWWTPSQKSLVKHRGNFRILTEGTSGMHTFEAQNGREPSEPNFYDGNGLGGVARKSSKPLMLEP